MLFDKFLNGDGTEKPLPANRRKAFFFYSKEHFGKLVLFSVFSAIFFIPSIIWLYVMNFSKAAAVSALSPEAENYSYSVMRITLGNAFTKYIVLIPFTVLFFLGLAGMFSAAKRMTEGRGCKVVHYFSGIKENGLRFAFCGLIYGISLFLFGYNGAYYATVKSNTVTALLTGFSVLQFTLVNIFSFWFMAGTVVYESRLSQALKNAVNLTFAKLFKNLLAFVLVALPVLIALIIPSPFQILALLALSFLYTGFAVLGFMSYAYYVFDRSLNPSLGSEYVGRGLKKAV